MERRTLGKSVLHLLISGVRKKMPRGRLTRYEMLSHMYSLKNDLKERPDSATEKYLADQYLNRVLDFINQFTY